jgi:hypothetical protein
MDILDRLEKAFSAAHEHLGIPRLLEPSDCYPNKPSDQVVMAYLSYFRNVRFQTQFSNDNPRRSESFG